MDNSEGAKPPQPEGKSPKKDPGAGLTNNPSLSDTPKLDNDQTNTKGKFPEIPKEGVVKNEETNKNTWELDDMDTTQGEKEPPQPGKPDDKSE